MSAGELGELDFSELTFRAEMITRKVDEENRGRLTAAAYTAWLMGSGGKMSSVEYLRSLGLIEKETVTEKQKELLVEKAHKIADRIMKMDKRGNRKGKK